MPKIKFKPTGYCVIRQSVINDDNDSFITNGITGVYGVFDTINEAGEFIFSVTDGAISNAKIGHQYTADYENVYSIHDTRTPLTSHHLVR